jgi:putative ABC transport system permease protein
MKTRFLVQEAVGALRSNLLRSLLTIIGIVVGIFSVTAMLALGAGLSANVLDRFSSFASGDITVSGDITRQNLAWITEQAYVTDAVGTMSSNSVAVVAGGSDFSPTVQAVLGDYDTLQAHTLVSGDVFDWRDASLRDTVAVVSDGFADTVAEETGINVLNQAITLNGQRYTVIGIIESSAMSFTRGDGLVIIPTGAAIGTITSSQTFTSVGILLEDATYFDIAGAHLLASLNTTRQLAVDSEDIYSVETSQSFIETAQETTAMISLFLGIVGGIALFVGGIGTMNMMLTTVTERTKEIGLRKAVGARNSDILLQILIESVLLTSLGGAIGIMLTVLGGKIANTIFADSDMISVLVNGQVILLAAGISVLIGIVFGLYPARNAARLLPVEALRSE